MAVKMETGAPWDCCLASEAFFFLLFLIESCDIFKEHRGLPYN